MNRPERKLLVFLALAGYVGAAIVAASTVRPGPGAFRTAVFPGVVYLSTVQALGQFARIAAVAPAAMGLLYAVAGYACWWVGGYLVGVRVLAIPRGELKAVVLAFPGVVVAAAGLALAAGGFGAAAGLVASDRRTPALLGVALVGAALWVPALAWLARVRSARFGWQSRALRQVDPAVEVGGYALLVAGLGLAAAAVAVDVAAQYLAVSVIGAVLVAVTVVVPTGGTRESGTQFG